MRTHVVGAGLAGLTAALALADAGRPVTLYEAGPSCGGRCRSYHDRVLDARIDNGNHLLLSGNEAAFGFLRRVGAEHTLVGPGRPMFPFADLRCGERWTLSLSRGRIPWWLALRRRRVPGTLLSEHASLLRLLRAPPGRTVAACIGDGALAQRLLSPLAIAILNTLPERGSASLLGAVFRQSLMRGGTACIPCFPRDGLSESFVDPALAALARHGSELRIGWRVASLERADGRVVSLTGPDGTQPVAAGEAVVLAVPPQAAAALLPELEVPDEFESIVNLHFKTDDFGQIADIGTARFVGLVGSIAEWVFVKNGVISVTVSAANRFADADPDKLTALIWRDVVAALSLPAGTTMPRCRLIREKRATFEATPAQERRRCSAAAAYAAATNVTLAGDWTATGLPATIEGAIRSGRTAARLVVGRT